MCIFCVSAWNTDRFSLAALGSPWLILPPGTLPFHLPSQSGVHFLDNSDISEILPCVSVVGCTVSSNPDASFLPWVALISSERGYHCCMEGPCSPSA